MKICLVAPWFPSLGANSVESHQGIFEQRQLLKLAERNNEFKVVCIRWRGQPGHEGTEGKVEVFRVPPWFVFPKIRYPVPDFIMLTRAISKVATGWKPDLIIYSHLIYLTVLPMFWLRHKPRIPLIATTDVFPGLSWFYGNKIVDSVGYIYCRLVVKRVAKLADGVQFLRSGLIEDAGKLNLDKGKIFTIPRGVDTEFFKPRSDPGGLRKELGIGESDTVILYVGRLDLVKGVKYLLEAAQRVLARHDKVRFLIVGDGNLRQEYEKFARPLFPRIIFIGWRKDVPQLMNISDIFVLPSLSEGAANAALEASASGLPVIGSKVGEVPNIVRDGETGILVMPEDVDGLERAMGKLISDPRLAKKMGIAARKRVEERYSQESICNELECAYQSVIDRFTREPSSLT